MHRGTTIILAFVLHFLSLIIGQYSHSVFCPDAFLAQYNFWLGFNICTYWFEWAKET